MESKESIKKNISSKEASPNSSGGSNQPINVSTQCKSCREDFTEQTIFKHITHKKTCKSAYTKKELELFQQWSKERNNSNRRAKLKKAYDPSKRRKRHLLEQKEKNKLTKKSDKNIFVNVSNRCKSCNIVFPESSIFKHISQNKKCKSSYSKEEIQSYSSWANERRNANRNMQYDSVKRRENYLKNKIDIAKTYQKCKGAIAESYHERIGKFIEKPADRGTLKHKSFVNVFNDCFNEACYEFFIDICMEVDEIVTESPYYTYISHKTHASITKTGKEFEEALNENIMKISKAIAKRAWYYPVDPFYFVKIAQEIELFYKKAFAKFYHDETFLKTYTETYDSCLEDVINSHHIWCTVFTSVDVALCGSVEKHCEQIFEKKFLSTIKEASEKSTIKSMKAFLYKEMKTKYPLIPEQISGMRNWLEQETKILN